MPRVSIIIPNYNHAAFLPQRLESVFAQSYHDYEVILLDDASRDGSVEILASYAQHPQVSCLRVNHENSGSPFKQWHQGITLARGDLIWIAESDDWADPQFLERLVPCFADESIALAYCASSIVDEHGRILRRDRSSDFLAPGRWQQDYVNDGDDEIVRYLLYRNVIINASAVVFRKADYLRVGGVDVTMRYAGDWWLWVKMLQRRKLAYLAFPGNYFREHSRTTRNRRALSEEKRCVAENVRVIEFILHAYRLDMQRDVIFSHYIRNHPWFSNGVNTWFKSALLRYLPLKRQSFFIVFYCKALVVLSKKWLRQIAGWLVVQR